MPRPSSRRLAGAALALGAFCALAAPAGAQPRPADRIEPGAGAWQTWILDIGSQFRLPAPPDAVATRAELSQLRGLVAETDADSRERIAWWHGAPPSYRWNQIFLEESQRAGLGANIASRRLALLHTALADAMVAAWDSKAAHDRLRPAEQEPGLRTHVPTPASPSYPEEHAVAAATAAALLADFFPQRAAEFARLAEEAGRMRLLAGVAFPSDVAAGTTLGRQVAQAALERGRRDGSDRPWAGSIPAGPGLWNGTNPVLPQAGGWTPWLLREPGEFRPPPPARHDSPERAAEMAVLRAFQRTPATNGHVLFWEGGAGGLRIHEYWNNHASRLLMEHGMAANAPRAARAYALLNVAFYDVGVACWDAKYAYWAIRPFQLDPEFRTVVTTPNHPSYPAAHACYSMTSATVLAHLFPRDAAALMALARDSGNSRIWGGLHYPSDVAAGQQLAERVAGRAIERARRDGAAD
jgi:membrane-associated phospholipid phosphatase